MLKNDGFHDIYLPFSIRRSGVKLHRDGPVVYTNVPHSVVHHSHDGFEWGYLGSGPSELALNILQWYLEDINHQGPRTQCHDGDCFSLAWSLHQKFKWEVIAGIPQGGGIIPYKYIREWIKDRSKEKA